MISTTPSDNIQDFLDFFAQLVGPESARNRTGAAEQDVRRFSELARYSLPSLYLGYLREFGERDPVLQLTGDAWSNVRVLIERYTERPDDSDYEIPKNGVVIGGQGLSGQRLLVYSDLPVRVSQEPTVAQGWWGEVANTLAETFRNYLYRRGFYAGRWARRPSFILDQAGDQRFPDVVRTARDLGFEAYWFSDNWQQCLERTDGSTPLVVRDSTGLGVYGASPEEKYLADFKQQLESLGLDDGGTSGGL